METKDIKRLTAESEAYIRSLIELVCDHCIANGEEPDNCVGYEILQGLRCIKAILFYNDRI